MGPRSSDTDAGTPAIETDTTSGSIGVGTAGSDSMDRQVWFMPAEFSPHLGCLMLYPHNRSCWRGEDCGPGRKAFRDVARAIASCGDPVTVFCPSEASAEQLQGELLREGPGDAGPGGCGVTVRVLPSDDSWSRDTGPTFVVGRGGEDGVSPDPELRLGGVDWGFNAYGGPEEGCYWPCDKDRQVARGMVEAVASDIKIGIDVQCISRHDIVLEGGAIHVDGEGTVLATEECLLHKNRNPHLTKEKIEELLLRQLGATKMIWIPRGLYMDEDTNGHIDNIACFASPGHVILAWSDDKDDPQHEIGKEALHVLNESTDAQGRRIHVTKLHVPPPMFYTQDEVETLGEGDSYGRDDKAPSSIATRLEGVRLAASYANFYIANSGIVVPGFGHRESDENAVKTLQSLFPDRKVVQVASREILLGGGNIHCITQQVPDPRGHATPN